MKKFTTILFLIILGLSAIGQDLAVTMTTSKAVGSQIYIGIGTVDKNLEIWFDLGDEVLNHGVTSDGSLGIRTTLRGPKPIKIYGTGIISIDCYNIQLTSLDVTRCTALKYLSCYQNQITELNLSNNPNLIKLNCGINNIQTLDLTNKTELTELDFSGNRLTTLNVTQNTKLTYLSCTGNNLTYNTLPVPQTNWQTYNYNSQNPIIISKNIDYGNEIDVSSQYSINGNITTYTWKTKTKGIVLGEGNDYVITNGKTTFLMPQTDSVYCEMTNALFPLSAGISALKTTCIKITGIIKQAQTISFYGRWVTDGINVLDGTATILVETSSYLPLTFESSDASIASISGNILTIHKGGSVTITATQAGDNTWYSATASKVITIHKVYQEIVFRSLPAKEPTDAPFNLTATSNSGLPITFTSSDPTIASISGNTVTIHKPGIITLTATQAGDDIWDKGSRSQTQQINRYSPTITFDPIPDKTVNDPPFQLTASSNSGLPFTFTSLDPTIASISGNTVTIIKAGYVTITATLAGNDNWNGKIISEGLNINKQSQTITFNSIPDKTLIDLPFELSASSNSGLPITFTSSAPTIASITGTTVTILNMGNVTITATQAGNDKWKSATAYSSFRIDQKTPTITFNLVTTRGINDPPFELSASSNSGLPIMYWSSDPSVISISGNTATIHKTGTTFINASLTGNDKWKPQTAERLMTINTKTAQTLTFNALPEKKMGDAPFELSATASSGLPVTYTSSDPLVASISGGTVTILKAGTVTITATQAGNESWNSATAEQTLTITSVTGIGEEKEVELIVYPNPATDMLHFKGEGTENMKVSIFNLTGTKVWSSLVKGQRADISQLPAGVYILKISNNKEDQTIRFVKQ